VHNGVGDDTLQVTIISDSLDSKQNVYLKYSLRTRKSDDPPTSYWYQYYKIDSAGNVFIGNGITFSRLQFKGNAQLGERWSTGYDVDTAFVYNVFESSILGVPTTVRHIGHKVGTEGYGEGYADGFGIVFRVGSYAIVGELNLIAATIGGIKYGDTTLTSVKVPSSQRIPTLTQLFPNYPNPFNGSTIITYILAEQGEITLTMYDILGREVKQLLQAYQETGQYSLRIESTNLSSGIYFYRLKTNGSSRTGKMNLQK
jgi:hypothetical protein